ncbi:MAG: hypothetical protein KDI49_07330 [Gammaproteobacteria bacterium]|nr:hypothetical protein [Gammaproteobacteria bacterium]MCB1878613.1 hypothetical protein [Gammaproteobacteria bacterium]
MHGITGRSFVGDAATAAFGGAVPVMPDGAHWATGVSSPVEGGELQSVAMGYELAINERKLLTELDLADLSDIGRLPRRH